MKSRICPVNSKQASYYVKEAQKLGYEVYVDDDEFFCVDVLTHEMFWHDPGNQYLTFPDGMVFDFKENV